MKSQPALKWLIPPIFVLALIAASFGLFDPTPGEPFPYTNHRGETVTINGSGLYFYDTVSSAAQMQGNDLITLIVGLPLLAFSALWASRGSLRGRLLLTGTLGFFLYTYLSMSTLTSYNHLFLVYVALFTLSLFAFILSMMSFDLISLPGHFSQKLPRAWIAGLEFVVAAFLGLAWLARIITPLSQNQTPALENTTTLVIQFMDLGLIVPMAVLAGILLLRRNAWGYLLSSVFVLKAITLGLAVSVMSINMSLKGVPDSLTIVVPFLVITAVNLVMAVLLLKNVNQRTILA
ncbi:MAG: hypothetical protein CVU44_09690 [Chloroflexi bacterium HGW-Chloroflexi-6]|nr:MAG: hypothetical protein CVU44_09690 [Chloroflexi bacterium HGW-Chloroflexi-6]